MIQEPPDKNTKIWRYMDFTKFVSLLDSQGLWFASLATLGEMDRFEGSYSKINMASRPEIMQKMFPAGSGYTHDPEKDGMYVREARKYIKVNCWHMNDYESAAMWKLYAKSGEAIAIQSTFMRLRDCLPERIALGGVYYIDYDKQWIPPHNKLFPAMCKRKAFEHERELRAVIPDLPPWAFEHTRDIVEGKLLEGEVIEPPSPGVLQPVDLVNLIESIYVAPTARTWFRNLVERVCSKYDLDKPIHPSSLEDEPSFF